MISFQGEADYGLSDEDRIMFTIRVFAHLQVCAVPDGRQVAEYRHGAAVPPVRHLPQPEVQQQEDQVPDRGHSAEGDAAGDRGHPSRRGGGQEDVPPGSHCQDHEV